MKIEGIGVGHLEDRQENGLAAVEPDTGIFVLGAQLGPADERSKLEGQWGRGDNVSTEDLRVALQRYRAFFDRLLSV